MQQLTKIQITTRDDLAEAIRHARAALDDTIRTYNDAVTSAYADVESAASAYNDAVADIVAWRDEIVEAMDAYVEGRDDEWARSDAADTFDAWRSPFEGLDAEEYEVCEPDQLDEIAADVAEELLALPTALPTAVTS